MKGVKSDDCRIFGCFSHRSNSIWSGGHIPMFLEKGLTMKT